MLFAEIRVESDSIDEQLTDAVNEFLGRMERCGRIANGGKVVATSEAVLAFVVAPEAWALELKDLDVLIKKESLLHGCRISVRELGRVADTGDACSCGHSSRFLLFTHLLSIDPPLRCLDCFGFVPLYRVPPNSAGDYSDILGWEANYKAFDTLQMDCGVGEQFREHEMSAIDSALTNCGLELCRQIEKRSGKATYYYLFRGTGRNVVSERSRACPICGGSWGLSETLHGKFDFLCERCRIVSNIAYDLGLPKLCD